LGRKDARRTTSPLLALLAACATARAQPPDPPAPSGRPADKAPGGAGAAGKEVARLVELLERHPARASTAAKHVAGLFLLDIAKGRATLIADEPDPGVGCCGCPDWSGDGTRILFDAMNADQAAQSHIKMISNIDGRPATTDLGGGNCPTFSPDGGRIAFLNNIGPPAGVWLLLADGSQRKSLGAYGRPRWSPDGRQMMVTSFSSPCRVMIMDADPETSGLLRIADSQIFSVPTWAAGKTLVAVVGDSDAIALIDTTEPAEGRVKEVLWRKGKGLDVTPEYPSYSPATREYVFVGTGPEGMALYSFRRGQKEPPRRLEPRGYDKMLRDPTFSPDGRYLVFTSDRPAPRPQEAGPGAVPARGDGR
jgi:dipeptidyl aminopeptidase/acylaminoacyl peptidase